MTCSILYKQSLGTLEKCQGTLEKCRNRSMDMKLRFESEHVPKMERYNLQSFFVAESSVCFMILAPFGAK